ncbi:hypothetical protein PIB30_115404, partial [Stylosanthes scabra]|nr:hypothetical protein [Stylosanthes scabra]
DVFLAELKRLQEERQAIIDAGGSEPPDRRGRSVDTDCGRPQEGEDLWDGCGSFP